MAMSVKEEVHEFDADWEKDRPKVLIAGAGITGLVSALGLLKQGFDVQIFEKDMTAIRGEGKYRGPIQVACLLSTLNLRLMTF